MSPSAGPLQDEIERRQRAESALWAAEEQFQHLVEDVKDYAIFLLDARGNIVSWNSGAERIKGYDATEIIGRHFSLFYPRPEAAAGIPERNLEFARSQGRYEAQGWRLRKDGSSFWAGVAITPLRDDQRRLRGFLKITRDLTEQMLAQQRLREANAELEQRVRARTAELAEANRSLQTQIVERERAEAVLRRQSDLLEQTYDPVLVWRFAGPIVYWNRAAQDVYNYSKQEAIGRISHELLETKFPESLAAVRQTLEQTGKWAGELTHTTKGGRRVEIESRMSLISERGERFVLETNRDISERKRTEAAIRRTNENLEALVRERTAQLQEVVESLQAFSYSVSHDLRAPLRNVQTLAEAMLEDYGDRLDEMGREYAERMIASASRMDSLIRDLLSYSRLTREELTLQPVSLSAAVGEALQELHSLPTADPAQPRPDVQVEEPLPVVNAHRAALVQALKNLLTNAVKFVAETVQPRVHVWAEDRGESVRLWIEDNGIGIAPEHRERIFEVFERLHGEESYPGTGIGLAIVRKAVDRMGGRCGVESEVGSGSRFWLELPKR